MYARNQELDLYTVGWWRLSCSLLQKSSHCCTGCVVCRLYADPPWCSDDLGNIRWQSAVGRRLTKLLLPDWVGSQIGCWKFVPGSWSRCWCAGINSGVDPHFTNCTNCGNHGCICYHLGCCSILCKFGQHSSSYTKWGKNIGIKRFNQHRENVFMQYASGSGLYDAYLEHLEFRRLANRSISGFPNWSKRDLTTLSFKGHSLLS